MANIVIKKRVSLEFLGSEYKESYLEFKSISVPQYEELLEDLKKAEDDGKKSLKLVLSILEKQFVSGQWQGEQVTKEDLKQFDMETMTECFELFTGRKNDPKA